MVDNVIAVLEANHPHLTTSKSFYVEISRARDRAQLVTDDAQALKERLEAVTGERISGLEGIGASVRTPEDYRRSETIAPGTYWVMAPLPGSYDSRYWGAINAEQIVGRVYPIF